MKSLKKETYLYAVIVALFALQGCSDYEPVAASECGKVVKHAQKVLGSMAPTYSELTKECKNASDKERGCILAATKKGQLAQCM